MPDDWKPLEDGEILVPSGDEKLWRNVNPDWIDNGEVSKQAFLPFPKDTDQLSCARSSKVEAAEHYREFTEDLHFASAGVWSVTATDVETASLRTIDDSDVAPPPADQPAGHAYIDYRSRGGGNAKKKSARHLRDVAQTAHEPDV